MFYTLGTAAKATGMTKSALSKAIAKGRISATKDDLGRFQIDPAELHRVYPPAASKPDKTGEQRETQVSGENGVGNTYKIIALETEVKGLRELLAQIKDERDRERKNHDATKDTLESLKRLLPPPLPMQAGALQGTESTEKPKKSFVSRLFGG